MASIALPTTTFRRGAVAFLALSVLLYPFLIGLLRQVMFRTVQTDDYAPYLLYVIGHPEGTIATAPWGYRILSVLAAAPFTIIPTTNFSLLPAGLSPAYLSATQAIAILSYLCMVGTICVAGHTAASRFRCGPLGVVLAGALAFLLCHFTALYSLDTPAILLVSLGVLALGRPVWFALLILASTFANEKVLMVFGLMLGVRVLLTPAAWRDHVVRLAPVVLACVLYALATRVVALPTLEHQEGLGRALDTIMGNLRTTISFRGLLLNVLPLLALASLAWVSRQGVKPEHAPYAMRSDWLVVALFLGIAMIASLSWNLGRIVMHAFPLFIGPAALLLEERLRTSGDLGMRRRRVQAGSAPT